MKLKLKLYFKKTLKVDKMQFLSVNYSVKFFFLVSFKSFIKNINIYIFTTENIYDLNRPMIYNMLNNMYYYMSNRYNRKKCNENNFEKSTALGKSQN